MTYSYTQEDQAGILIEALPYIQKYNGKTVVIKYGGNAMINEDLKHQVMEDIALLSYIGIRVVLVHGGGPEISSLMNRLGKQAEFIDGLRVTDKETIDIAQMVLAGKINKSLVNLLDHYGGSAIGLSGIDGNMIQAEFKDERLGYVGNITMVNARPIIDILEKDYIPVIATLGCDEEGNTYNINGDTAAAYIAGALQAERLLMMTDVPGSLRDKDDLSTLIPKISVEEAKQLREDGIIAGGMIPKVECCIEAIRSGVKNVVIMDGRIPHSILMELLTDEGAGTMVTGEIDNE